MNWVGGFSFCLFIGLLLAASLKKLKQRGKKKKERKKEKDPSACRSADPKSRTFCPPININNRNSYQQNTLTTSNFKQRR